MKYAELGEATVEQMIKLGEVWQADIDASGWRKTWEKCLAGAILQKNQEKQARSRLTRPAWAWAEVWNDFYRVVDAPELGFRNRRFQGVPFLLQKMIDLREKNATSH